MPGLKCFEVPDIGLSIFKHLESMEFIGILYQMNNWSQVWPSGVRHCTLISKGPRRSGVNTYPFQDKDRAWMGAGNYPRVIFLIWRKKLMHGGTWPMGFPNQTISQKGAAILHAHLWILAAHSQSRCSEPQLSGPHAIFFAPTTKTCQVRIGKSTFWTIFEIISGILRS